MTYVLKIGPGHYRTVIGAERLAMFLNKNPSWLVIGKRNVRHV